MHPARIAHMIAFLLRDDARSIPAEVSATTTERLWAMLDANYNVVGLLEMPDWHVRERYTYDAYGQVEVRDANFNLKTTDTDYDWQHLFTGQRLDHETGLYHYRHRQYHPNLGRFTAKDPLHYSANDPNLYRYVKSSPANKYDPFGLYALALPAAGVAAAADGPEVPLFFGPGVMRVSKALELAPKFGPLGMLENKVFQGRHACPEKIANSRGVCPPRELCGRGSLYSRIHAWIFSWASSIDKNQC